MILFKSEKEDKTELSLGDVVILKAPVDDPMFFNSNIGKRFKDGICDTLELTCKQYPWLEVYFETKLKKNGKYVTEAEEFKTDPSDSDYERESKTLASENADYRFLRYCLLKGAVKD